jgi:hypothetical protein
MQYPIHKLSQLGSTSDLAMEYRRCASSEWLWTLPLVIYRGLRYKESFVSIWLDSNLRPSDS